MIVLIITQKTETGAVWLSDCTHHDKKWTENGAVWLNDCTHHYSKNRNWSCLAEQLYSS